MTVTIDTPTIQRKGAGKSPARVAEIDTAKGIGIVLVVLGHMVAHDLKPQGNDWWQSWHDHLYTFHMAFFFFLSGYVFFLEAPDRWPARVRKTAAKLIPAYLLFALIVYVAKAAAVHMLHVDRPVQEPLDELVKMLVYPLSGFAQFLWFIVTLMMINVLMLALRNWVLRFFAISLGLAFAAHLLSVYGYVTEMFALSQLARYTLFFLIAAACHRYPAAWKALVTRYGVFFVAALVLALATLPELWLETVAALLSIPALVAIAVWLERWPAARDLMQYFGRNTLTIYLMSSLTVGLARALVVRTWGWDGWHFFAVAPLLLASGLFLPIVVQRLALSRVRWLDRITR